MKTKTTILIILFIVTLSHNNSFAQWKPLNQSAAVNSDETKEETKEPMIYNRNIVKFNVTGMFSGLAGVYYERELSRLFSIEIGGGLTFRNLSGNIYFDLMDEIFVKDQQSPNFSNGDDVQDFDYKFDRRRAKSGTYLSIMPRYYFEEDGVEGNYIGLNFQYRNYNFEAFGIEERSSTFGDFTFLDGTGNRKEFERHTIVAFCWGYQKVGTIAAFEVFAGAGIRSIHGERIDIGYSNDPVTYNSTPIVGSQMRDIRKINPFIEGGFRFGFWWH